MEFAGWLPIYEKSGDCGRHPQFTHTGEPPPGYRFTCSAPPKPRRTETMLGRIATRCLVSARRIANKVGALARLFVSLVRPIPGVTLRTRLRISRPSSESARRCSRAGTAPAAVWQFLHTRHLRSQLLLSSNRGLVFLTSMPYTYGQNPWVIEIEDPTTLFYPLIQNGGTCDLEIRESPYFPIIKNLLESDSCKGIVTHIRSTAAMVPTLFGGDIYRKKVLYAPLGVKLPPRWQRHELRRRR